MEVATNVRGVVAVRDSKDPDGPMPGVTAETCRAFLARLHGRS